MEARCGKCSKIFRIPDDKITGKGIKFACTRCSETVKITSEEFEQYVLSKTAVSTLDLFESNPKPDRDQPQPATMEKELEPPVTEAKQESFVLSTPADQDVLQEEKAPLFTEPVPVAEAKPVAELKTATEPQTEPAPVTAPEPEADLRPKPEPEPRLELKAEKKTAFVQPQAESKALIEPNAVVARPAAQAVPRSGPMAPPAAQKIELARPAPRSADMTPKSTSPTSTLAGNVFPTLVVITIIVIGYAGYGVFTSLQPPSKKSNDNAQEVVSIEGLRIPSTSSSMEPNGDLLISGAVVNELNKERPTWYVMVEVYDARGAVLSKIRLLNGKQLYTQRDYNILANRGVNIQELKAKSLQEQGIVIPPKGSVPFEIRYFQPTIGIASFNTMLQPFDPIRLFKEISGDIK